MVTKMMVVLDHILVTEDTNMESHTIEFKGSVILRIRCNITNEVRWYSGFGKQYRDVVAKGYELIFKDEVNS